jgi:hypothetical protein
MNSIDNFIESYNINNKTGKTWRNTKSASACPKSALSNIRYPPTHAEQRQRNRITCERT